MEKNVIDQFIQEYNFLSNAYPCLITYGAYTYQNATAAYYAQKTRSTKVKQTLTEMLADSANNLGKSLEPTEDWDERKDTVMKKVIKIKFSDNPELKEKLLATGDAELINTNWWGDQYWGICGGYGENKLGKILMEVREELAANG